MKETIAYENLTFSVSTSAYVTGLMWIVVCQNRSRSSNPQTAAEIERNGMKHWYVPGLIGRLACPHGPIGGLVSIISVATSKSGPVVMGLCSA